MRRTLAAAAVLAALAVPFADAKTLRWSSQGDYLTADPMAQNELLTNSINGHVYESLIMRGKKLKPERMGMEDEEEETSSDYEKQGECSESDGRGN